MICTSGEDRLRQQHPRLPCRRQTQLDRSGEGRQGTPCRPAFERPPSARRRHARLGELFNVLLRSGIERPDARLLVRRYAGEFEVAAIDQACFEQAFDLAVDHRLQIWDALIMTASARAGCDLLLSEDMQDGFTVLGITIVNAVAKRPHPHLAALLGD